MHVKSVEPQEHSMVSLTIEVSKEEFEPAVERVYRKQRGRIAIPGFRKGRAPRKVIEGMYGANVFYQDAVNELYPKAYEEAVKEQGLEVAAWPQVEVQDVGPEGFTFTALVAVRPEVKLGEYKGLSAPKDVAEITPEDLENELKPFAERASRVITVERPAQTGDRVLIDFEGTLDGVPFEGGKAERYPLELGSGQFIPGFEDQIVGMSAGEEKDLNVTFPEEYGVEELAGKPAVFHVLLHEVKTREMPVLDDEFAKDVSEFDTLEELKSDLGEQLKTRREEEAQNAFERSLIEQVSNNIEVEIPDPMLEQYAGRIFSDYARQMQNSGLPLEQYLRFTGQSMEELREKTRQSAREQILRDLALGAIAKAEGFQVSDEDLEQEYQKLAEEHKLPLEKVKEQVSEKVLREELLARQAAQLVFDTAQIGPAPEPAEASEPEQAEASEEKPKPKRTRKKAAPKTEEAGEGEGGEKPKPKRTRRKKTEEPAAESAEE